MDFYTPMKAAEQKTAGGFLNIENERFYKISDVDQMSPFLMSITSASNLWMFVSSNGGITCGRSNTEHALFPYGSDDVIHDSIFTTGPCAAFWVKTSKGDILWEPFSYHPVKTWRVQQNLYKNKAGNSVIFEEINHDLNLRFRYQWMNSDRYGFIKRTSLKNLDAKMTCEIECIDGLRNILPPDVNPGMQSDKSTVIDAYKISRMDEKTGLGLYFLSSAISDRAEALESLKANVVYVAGLKKFDTAISPGTYTNFLQGKPTKGEQEIMGRRGNYFIRTKLSILPLKKEQWYMVADTDFSHADIIDLSDSLRDKKLMPSELQESVKSDSNRLQRFVNKADGMQLTSDEVDTARHFSNVLFNIMRGGFFPEGYSINRFDLAAFLRTHNLAIYNKYHSMIEAFNEQTSLSDIKQLAIEQNDPDLERLLIEYLPLTFSRRHGDPSRPWNKFDINIGDPDNAMRIDFQGNWRDIFQNWEALLFSYPRFIENIVSKFLNASTIDGYNPYRITSQGIDWEIFDPEDPWSNIGYWGDHQIIYLLRLLEMFKDHYPKRLFELFSGKRFVYANVPYKIKEFDAIINNPKDTIEYDANLEKIIQERCSEIGSDGKLVFKNKESILYATLLEKLLLPLITKLSNFVPDAGIWMNTQRPEWNDANNALVGNGVSMVTVYYMHRYVKFLLQMVGNLEDEEFIVSKSLSDFLQAQQKVFDVYDTNLEHGFEKNKRFKFIQDMGIAGMSYRKAVYTTYVNPSETTISKSLIEAFLESSLAFIGQSIVNNRRSDGLYHAYNTIQIDNETIQIGHLQLMLEGQVAITGSGYLNAGQVLELTQKLGESSLYREDQQSYMLYPNQIPERFIEKNNIEPELVAGIELLAQLESDGCKDILEKDARGVYHFSASIKNADHLNDIMNVLQESYPDAVNTCRKQVLDLFESLFDHRSFTGRSGRFFKYEGLGSIYWHMVSKYALSVIEVMSKTEDKPLQKELIKAYFNLKAGIGAHKSPRQYGAFPMDPYSHTPFFGGVQQPGMTGQVKEDIIARWKELGMEIKNGCLLFKPNKNIDQMLINNPGNFSWFNLNGDKESIEINSDALLFTYCQVPFIYIKGSKMEIKVYFSKSAMHTIEGNVLTPNLSSEIFSRSGKIKYVVISY